MSLNKILNLFLFFFPFFLFFQEQTKPKNLYYLIIQYLDLIIHITNVTRDTK